MTEDVRTRFAPVARDCRGGHLPGGRTGHALIRARRPGGAGRPT